MIVRFSRILLVLGVAAACGPAPVPLTEEEARASEPTPPTMATMPDDEVHAGLRSGSREGGMTDPHEAGMGSGDESYAGVVRLQGALAEVQEAYLFISAMPVGMNRPACSSKIDLADEALGERSEGERVVPFVLDGCNAVPGEVELQVWFDLDGYVDSKEEGSVIRRYPIEPQDREIDVALAPGA